MNLLCPNCQKMLTVPEQFAGQLMKCPLCSGTFTVPALPTSGGSDPAVPAFQPPPLPATTQTAANPSPPTGETSTSSLQPAFAMSAPTSTGTGSAAPAFATMPSSSASSASSSEPKPTVAPQPTGSGSAGSVSTEGYTREIRLAANPRILQWVPLVCLVAIFVLQFFPWVGVYPGGVPALRQDAWQAALGTASIEIDMKDKLSFLDEQYQQAVDPKAAEKQDAKKEMNPRVGVSLLMLFYLFPFFLVTFLFTIFVAIQPYAQMKLPPQVAQLLPWKWAILTGLNVVLLLFLGLQCLLNFDVESRARTGVENDPAFKRPVKISKDQIDLDYEKGLRLQWLRRTNWLRLVVVLHLLSTAAVGLVYWMERRGPAKPPPMLELRW